MKVEDLVLWLEKHKTDKEYQYKDLSMEEFDAKALASFNRIPEDQKKKVLKVCKHYGITDMNLILRARFMAQTNLFSLCKLLEKYKNVSDKEYLWVDGKMHSTHQEICNDFFVKKDPTYKEFITFANEYIDKKERLLLVPRGGFKSSMNMADCVQWIIVFPEISILVLTGILELAKDFVGEIKGHFELDDADDSFNEIFGLKKPYQAKQVPDGSSSLFQVLFPEHCLPKDTGKSDQYQTPAISIQPKEGTLSAASIEQSLTGWHVGVLKLDDVCTNENTQTVDRIKNINKQVSINQAMLDPFGFYDKIGTWYDSEDTYGQDIKNAKKYEEDGEDFPTKIYIRAAWWATEEAKKLGKIEEEMTEADYGLWFNEQGRLTYNFLKNKKKTDPWFAIKYLNDPTQMHIIKFPRELLVRRTIQANLIPGTGMIVTAVDTAYSTKSWADYTVIMTALIYGGRFYVIDMQRGKFNEYELPALIAATALKWKPKRICIEESVGVKWLGREVYREMDKLKVRSPIEFVSLGKGSKGNSKMIKAKPVLRFLGDERLLFSNSCPNLDDLYEELSKFGTAAALHDDIVDSLSLLITQFASYAEMEGRLTAQQSDFNPNPKSGSMYNMIHGLGKYAEQVQLENPEMSPQDIVKSHFESMQETQDPLSDIFG
jgi:predicted phage terminase large subunit-like protein